MTFWNPISVGAIDLPHRLAMAPMTRDRSRPDGVPTDLNRESYRQRASMALIITEGTQPSEDGQGYLLTPGIYTEAHIAGRQEVTSAVHSAGGRIVVNAASASQSDTGAVEGAPRSSAYLFAPILTPPSLPGLTTTGGRSGRLATPMTSAATRD